MSLGEAVDWMAKLFANALKASRRDEFNADKSSRLQIKLIVII